MTHLIVCDPNQKVSYFAEVSPFAKGMPDVCLRDVLGGGFDDLARKGPSLGLKEAQSTPIVAVADAMPSSKHIKVGFGDPMQPESQTWTSMKNVHDDPKTLSERYVWVRGAAGEKDDSDMSERGNSKELYRMLSDSGVVASFRKAAMTSVKKRGVLRIYDTPAGDDTLLFIFLSCAALCEKERPRKVKKGLLFGLGSKS